MVPPKKAGLNIQVTAMARWFGSDKGKTAIQHGHECAITEWEDHNGEPIIPAVVQFSFGGQDTTDPAFRDQVERGFDQRSPWKRLKSASAE